MRDTLIAARGSRTQADVAQAIGISQRYISKIELGQRTPSLKVASKIAVYYNQGIDTLFPELFSPQESPNCSIT